MKQRPSRCVGFSQMWVLWLQKISPQTSDGLPELKAKNRTSLASVSAEIIWSPVRSWEHLQDPSERSSPSTNIPTKVWWAIGIQHKKPQVATLSQWRDNTGINKRLLKSLQDRARPGTRYRYRVDTTGIGIGSKSIPKLADTDTFKFQIPALFLFEPRVNS